MLERLTSISDFSETAILPRYRPRDHKPGIVHIGLGAFHRAHQAVYTDAAIAEAGGDWRIIGVNLRRKDIADELNEQHGLYTVLERGAAGTKARVIGTIDRAIGGDAYAALGALCDPAIRIVTLTVTEKGYGIDHQTGLPDTSNDIVKADLASPKMPKGVLGILVEALRKRKVEKCPPLTLLSCDNLPSNGAFLRRGIIGFSKMIGNDDLANWIDQNIAFPSSMVDRITPASTETTRLKAAELIGCTDYAAVETEPFSQWVIEDDFTSGRPKWEAGGAIFVPDVVPYEKMKLTMLNGAHSMMAYAGFLSDCEYVRDVMERSDLRQLVKRHMQAAACLLKPLAEIDYADYTRALEDRFSNPAIAHGTYQIATDGSQKLPQRIFEPALNAIDINVSLRPFAFATAAWMRFCRGKTDDGIEYEIHDPLAPALINAACASDDDAGVILDAFKALPGLIPEKLAFDAAWNLELKSILRVMLTNGFAAAVHDEVSNFSE